MLERLRAGAQRLRRGIAVVRNRRGGVGAAIGAVLLFLAFVFLLAAIFEGSWLQSFLSGLGGNRP